MPRICLNPGHYIGIDPGAVGAKSTEAQLVMDYANMIKPMLEKVGYEVNIVSYNELEDIVYASDSWNADLFVSIHCNSAGSPYAYGTETFYYIDSPNGKKLANCLQNQLEPVMREFRILYKNATTEEEKKTIADTSDRGLKTNSLYVVRNTNAVAALVEVGFISNTMDEEIMIARKTEIASAIARGISDYYA